MKLNIRAAGVIVAGLLFALFAENASSRSDSTAQLFAALRNGDADTVRALAGRGVNINTANPSGETPLMYASMYSSPDIVKLLLNRGADPNAKSATATTALMLATGNAEKVRLLLAKGARCEREIGQRTNCCADRGLALRRWSCSANTSRTGSRRECQRRIARDASHSRRCGRIDSAHRNREDTRWKGAGLPPGRWSQSRLEGQLWRGCPFGRRAEWQYR